MDRWMDWISFSTLICLSNSMLQNEALKKNEAKQPFLPVVPGLKLKSWIRHVGAVKILDYRTGLKQRGLWTTEKQLTVLRSFYCSGSECFVVWKGKVWIQKYTWLIFISQDERSCFKLQSSIMPYCVWPLYYLKKKKTRKVKIIAWCENKDCV